MSFQFKQSPSRPSNSMRRVRKRTTTKSSAPAPAFRPASHRVLFVPELLEFIFSYLDREDNVNNACVCKQWSTIGLDMLWRNVDNIFQLFNALCPIECLEGHVWKFQRTPDAIDWSKFAKYARRVRCLRLNEHPLTIRSVLSILEDVALTRTASEILPNLHTLEWVTSSPRSAERAVLFMHPRVRTLIISVPDVISGGGPSRTRKFFMDFVTRMPRLTKLDLRVPFSIESVEDIIIDTLLAGLPELRTVIFPEFFFTSRIVTHLATMQHIGVIQFEHGDEQGRGDPADVAHFEPMLLPGAFPQLYDLSLTGRLEHLTAFMNAPTAPINLTQLYLNSYWAQTPAEVHTLFSVLADSCSLLNVLVLELLHIPPGHFYVQGPLAVHPPDPPHTMTATGPGPAAHARLRGHAALAPLTYEDLAPALSLPNLTHFEIMHGAPVHVTFEQLEKLAQSWPSLELLKLNPEPLLALDGYPALGLRALIPFARHCPRLHTLGLFLDDAPTPVRAPSLPRTKSKSKSTSSKSSASSSSISSLSSSSPAPSTSTPAPPSAALAFPPSFEDALPTIRSRSRPLPSAPFPSPIPSQHELESLNPFPSLRTLYVGLSRARSPQTVALVLSALCPPGCLLQWGTSWTDPAECVAPEMVERIRERCAPWEEVARLLPVLARLRREERARARRLKYENEELRTVNRVLREEARAIPGGKRQDSCVIC